MQLGTGADGPSFTTGVAALELLGDEEEEDEVNLEMVGWLVLVLDCVDSWGAYQSRAAGLWSSCWFETNCRFAAICILTFRSLLVAGWSWT